MEKLLDVISLSIFLNMDKYFPWGTIQDNANDNRAEVFCKLPALSKGEEYVLPVDTYFSFQVTGVDENGGRSIQRVSKWIMDAYRRA